MLKLINKSLVGLTALFPCCVFATTVQFQTVMGDITVELFDEHTPQTVANFLRYVDEQAYNNTIIHRSVKDFVIQGGGYTYNDGELDSVTTYAPVANEPVLANVRGTIAMAKVGGRPHSATSQWFFNLNNNSAALDNDNEGFTVFGQVTEGMAVIDAIANVQRYRGGIFQEIPLRDWDPDSDSALTDEHFVLIEQIVVLDAAPDTAADLNPPATTRRPQAKTDSGGGAGIPLSWLSALVTIALLRRRTIKSCN